MTSLIHSPQSSSIPQSENLCVVCLLNLDEVLLPGSVSDEEIEAQISRVATFTLSCQHTFHKDCIAQWVRNKARLKHFKDCPLCRQAIDTALCKALYPNYRPEPEPVVLGHPRMMRAAPQQERMEEPPPRLLGRLCEEPVTVLQERTKSAFLGSGLGMVSGVGGAAVFACCGTPAVPNVLVIGAGGACVGMVHGCSKDRDCCADACNGALAGGTAGLASGLLGWPMFPAASFLNGIATGLSGGAILGCLSGLKTEHLTG